MVSETVKINIPGEIERKAALLVQTASSFDSRIHISYLNKSINAKSIMGVMTLPLSDGDEVTITAEGADENKAMKEMAEFFTGGID